MAFLGRELACKIGQKDNFFVKLEVISDPKYLLPDPLGTLKAAEFLVQKGFTVLPYINADPMLALHMEDIGCATVMPLGSPIGSGQGINNLTNLQIIIENAKVPVIIDAGIGTPSEAAMAMEIGADGILLNTAVAQSRNPSQMAYAMNLGVQSGRLAYLAGRMKKKTYASASSPLDIKDKSLWNNSSHFYDPKTEKNAIFKKWTKEFISAWKFIDKLVDNLLTNRNVENY